MAFKQQNVSSMKSGAWILSVLFQYRLLLFVTLLMSLISISLQSIVPICIGMIFDALINSNNALTLLEQRETVNTLVILIVVILICRVLIGWIGSITNDRLAWRTEIAVRESFYENIQSKPLRFHDHTRKGEMMALATNDTRTINNMISPGLLFGLQVIFSLITVIIISFTMVDWRLAASLGFFIPFYIWSLWHFNKKLAPIAARFQREFAGIATAAQDNIEGARVVRAFGAEEFEWTRFSKAILAFRDTWRISQNINARYYPSLVLMLAIGVNSLVGFYLVSAGEITPGTVIAFDSLLVMLMFPTFIFQFGIGIIQAGLAGASRIYGIMQIDEPEEDEFEEKAKIGWQDDIKGEISFKSVSFAYERDNKPILNDISFTIKPGERLALVGPTGCGKTTLVKLMLRLYSIEKGIIAIDGIPIDEFKLKDLRSNIGYIEQDIWLANTTIRENISYGKHGATGDEIEEVAKMAQVYEFVNEMPDKIDTVVGERGVQLSGGQRQRIAIARAFLTNPKILLIDDSTSAIDSKTEERIVLAMDRLLEGRTSIIITHRLGMIRRCDRVCVLKEGSVIAYGSHDELLRTSWDYRRVFGKQLEVS